MKIDPIMEYDNKEPSLRSPTLPDSPNSSNDINKRNSFNSSPYGFSNYLRGNSLNNNTNIKPYSKKQVNSDIQNINKEYNDLDKITNKIHEQYEDNKNKMEIITNETIEITNNLNDDLFIRLKVYEENKQNKTYYKRNIASEIGFITLDYLLTGNIL